MSWRSFPPLPVGDLQYYASTTARIVQTSRNATIRSALLEKSHSIIVVSVLS
jgi:hypothetical protein